MNRTQRKALDLQHPMVEFLEVSGVNVALVLLGVAIMCAEVWLLTIGTSIILVAVLLALTGFTVFVLGQRIWEDWR